MLTLYITKKGHRIRADKYGPVGASGEWATQGCSGRVVVEVGARFHPERLIGGTEAASPGAAEATLYVCSGALVQGGVFDLSAGSIWLGAGALVEPGVLLRGPAVIGAGTMGGGAGRSRAAPSPLPCYFRASACIRRWQCGYFYD